LHRHRADHGDHRGGVEFGLVRIELAVNCDNARAIALYRRRHFQVEGMLRDGAYVRGAFVDMLIMATVRHRAASS
jgi:RimJ/RimL family protein N-acetyltransferase